MSAVILLTGILMAAFPLSIGTVMVWKGEKPLLKWIGRVLIALGAMYLLLVLAVA